MAIAFNAAADGGNTTIASSYSYSYTCGSGSNRMLLVGVEGNVSSDLITGVTYNGVAMTLVNKQLVQRWMYLFYLLSPTSGANTVAISASGTCDLILSGAADYTGVIGLDLAVQSTSGSANSITKSITTLVNNDWVMWYGTGFDASSAPSTSTGSTRAVEGSFGSWALCDSNAVVSPAGAFSAEFGYSGTSAGGLGIIVAAFSPVVPPTPVNTGPFKRTGIPKLKHGHPLAAGLLYYRFDTGLGFDVNLCPGATVNSSPIAPPPGVWWNTSVNTPQQYNFYLNPPVIMTPYGAAGYFYQNAGAGNSGNPGSVTNPGIQSWMDFNFPEVPWFNNAQNLYNLGTGAGFSFACGMLHKGTAIAQTSGGSGNPVGPGIGGWITGREDYAAEAGSYVQYGFYKGTSQANTIWCQLMNGPASSPGYTLVGSSGYTSTPNAYTTLSCTVLNTTGTAGSGNGSGTATFYAQGVPVATQTSVNLCTRLGNGENQVCKGSIYHPGTGSALVTLDGVVYWDAAWSRALTPEENQLLATNPYCLLEWPDDSLKNTIFLSSGGNTYTISAAEGTYTLTGKTQAVNAFRSIIATEGVYSLTGKPQTFGIGIGASQGSYSLTGEPQAFAIVMPVSEGVYALTGEAVTLTTSSSPTLVAAEGTYSLVGEPQKFAVALSCLAQHGVYVLTGKPQVLSLNRFGAGGGQSGGHKFIADMGNQTESNF